jgi:lipoprotein-releasing system permease protein
MNFTGYIAGRYFFAKSSRNAVNIISGISILGVLVGTFSLIIVLSAFNGLEDLVGGFYGKFNPDFKVTPKTGKYFQPGEDKLSALRNIEGVYTVSSVLEERVLFTFQEKEHIGSLKGVDSSYRYVTGITSAIRDGEYALYFRDSTPALVLGAGVSYYLGYGRYSLHDPLQIFTPRSGASSLDFNSAFSSRIAYPTAIFSIQPEFDIKYAITNLAFVRELLDRPEALSAIELRIDENVMAEAIRERIIAVMGPEFDVKDRVEQQAVFMKVMKTESLFTFLVFTLILGIASFTIMGSLSMMMLDKRDHLRTLWAMGADIGTLRRVFFKEGLLISGAGLLLGLVLGLLAVMAQEQFGWIKLGQGYVVEAYPVVLRLRDLLLVAVTVAGLGGLSSWLTSRRLTHTFLQGSKE